MARERRLSFGGVAELYDRRRPSYPPALVDDVLEPAALGNASRVLEVGAGTGKATVLFAARGLHILALEPDPAMAQVAAHNCAAYPLVQFECTDFERWPGDGTRFPLLYSATAWHWVSREQRYPRARAVLQDDGVLAAFWNRPDWGRSELRDELRAAYRRAVPEFAADGPMHPASEPVPTSSDDWEREIGRAESFDRAEVRVYRWTCDYSAADYTQLLQTHSDHMLIPDGPRRSLLDAVRGVIGRGGGSLRLEYVTRLCLARAC